MTLLSKHKKYRNVYFINHVESIEAFRRNSDFEKDLVLTENFSVIQEINEIQGNVYYFQTLEEIEIMQQNNFHAQTFLEKWNLDLNGNDIFKFEDVNFGISFRIFIWTELLELIRNFSNLAVLQEMEWEKVFLSEECLYLVPYLKELKIEHAILEGCKHGSKTSLKHFFSNSKYMSDSLEKPSYPKRILQKILDIYVEIKNSVERLTSRNTSKKIVIAQVYHPTIPIISNLADQNTIKLFTTSLVGIGLHNRYARASYIPKPILNLNFSKEWRKINEKFLLNKNAKLLLGKDLDLTSVAYELIESRVFPRTKEAICMIRKVKKYQNKQPFHLEIQFSNLGFFESIVSNVLHNARVPSFIVQNGLMTQRFGDEGKFATYKNVYGESIAKHYFKGTANVYALGDPRMDKYSNISQNKKINRSNPVIGIGSSAFNSIDLVSHSAVEFDFLFDLLSAILSSEVSGLCKKIKIKVRPNSELRDYQTFIDRYFPMANIEMVQSQSMIDFLREVDLYVSIYSQTLFEASAMGIPAIYFKIDRELHHPPFDGRSELLVASSLTELKSLLSSFIRNENIFNNFLSKEVMEKYVGNLQGHALKANLQFIDKILAGKI